MPDSRRAQAVLLAAVVSLVAGQRIARGENWPQWRGPGGNAVSGETPLPVRWGSEQNVRWRAEIPGEGYSSPIVWGNRLFVTTALEAGSRRAVICLDSRDGRPLWRREIEDDFPEITSPLTGHAAATPVCDGRHVVAFFGNAGMICYDLEGRELWRRKFGYFDSELGLASSPVIVGDLVVQLCDHDGNRFDSFDSFIIALDVTTGRTRWRTERPRLYRSWSTPLVVHAGEAAPQLIVNAQDELRAYDSKSGKQLWTARGMTGWVTPSPVFAEGMIFATSGRQGPVMAVRPGGKGDVTGSHVAWKVEHGGPYVCSPLWYAGRLYVHNEQGVLKCWDARRGQLLYQQRLGGKFTSSSVAGDGKVYLANEAGTTYVLADGEEYRLLAENSLDDHCVASPAISSGQLFIRTERYLWCIAGQ